MWPHFLNFLLRVLRGMPLLVSSNWGAWILGLVLFLLYEVAVLVRRGWEDMKQRWTDNFVMGVLVTAIGYLILFSWSVFQTIYDDHHDDTGRWRAVVNEKNVLKSELSNRDAYIYRLDNRRCPQCNKSGAAVAPAMQDLPNISWTQEQTEPIDGKPTVTVLFRVDATLNLPAFVAICDRPCKPVFAEAGTMSHRRDINWLGRSDLAGVFFDMPKPLPAGTSCKLRIASADSTPVKITTFRILKEAEIPVELR